MLTEVLLSNSSASWSVSFESYNWMTVGSGLAACFWEAHGVEKSKAINVADIMYK